MSTSPDDTSPDCALCERKAKSRCSACKSIWFCSEQCQTTLWPVHKSLCKADPSIFSQAPLTKQELAELEALSAGLYTLGPGAPPESDAMPIRQVLLAASSLRDWSELLSLLRTPATNTSLAREKAITMARVQITNSLFDKPASSIASNKPWLQIAYYMTHVRVAYGLAMAEDGRMEHGAEHLIQEMNAFLRQLLIQGVVDYHVMRSSVTNMIPWLPLLYLARDRALAELEKATAPPLVAARLRPLLLEKYEELRYLMWNERETTPPAVHP